MNYSSYLGSKKCNKVICTQGPPGPPGPQGPPGTLLNTFTITSSSAIHDIGNSTITWNFDIPFIYGRQFTFTFQTFNINVTSIDILNSELPSDKLVNTFSNSYIFGTGQAVYQSYTIDGNSNNINYAYIPIIICNQGTDTTNGSSFDIKVTVETNNTVTYSFVYQYDPTQNDYHNFLISTIKLNGIKCN